ncbi:AlpA family transcriptional regulator [Ahrensia sp. R2A130]|uniref:helix-turn-helix transcriptional regulator n=1 Tax=Ahrensia sp. R2A130 TaxID=744979 RepID=UPI0009FE9402|nr:AlpA family phage regulatory protein [Ahrensia sp. R2A130]
MHTPSGTPAPQIDTPSFPNTGLVRLAHILAPRGPIPVSKSTWWQGVKDGRFPQPHKLGPRTTVWRAEDIRALFTTADDHHA